MASATPRPSQIEEMRNRPGSAVVDVYANGELIGTITDTYAATLWQRWNSHERLVAALRDIEGLLESLPIRKTNGATVTVIRLARTALAEAEE